MALRLRSPLVFPDGTSQATAAAAGGAGAGTRWVRQVALAADAATSTVLALPASPVLWVTYCITGYASGGGIAGVRFGTGATPESGARYWHRNHPSQVTNIATWGTSVQATLATGLLIANANLSLGRIVTMTVSNPAATAHPATWQTTNSSNSTSTPALAVFGHGEYVSTAAGRITSAQMYVSGGNLTAGTSLIVEGLV